MKRNTNIELLRILLSFLVVAWHIGVKYINKFDSTVSFNVMQPLLIAPVITFGIISGYFLRENNYINWKKFAITIAYYWFISILITIILAILGIIPWTKTNKDTPIDKYALGLILSGGGYWWYVFAFAVSSLLVPLINTGLEKKSNLKLEITIIVVIWLLTFNNNFWFTLSDTNANQPGNFVPFPSSVTNYAKWTICLLNAYLIGGVMKKYGEKMFRSKFLFVYISIILFFMCITTMESFGLFKTASIFGRELFLDHADIFTPVVAIALFSIFKMIHLKSNRFINFVAKTTFPIYLFQFIFILLINNFNIKITNYDELNFWIISIFGWFSTFVFAVLINQLFNFFSNKIMNKNRTKNEDISVKK